MEEQISILPKKTTRARKTASLQSATIQEGTQPVNTVNFDELVARILQSKQEFDNLQKEITQAKQDWVKEQKDNEIENTQRNTQEEVERKRDEETYQYSTSLNRKRTEDEFQDKKFTWEKDLAQRKEELESQKRELDQLRKLATDFESQKETAVKEAQTLLQRELTEKFNQEKILREQEVKAEKEIFGLKIANLETENSRLNKEIEIVKRSLDEATRQVREIAVKVIESGSSQNKPQTIVE